MQGYLGKETDQMLVLLLKTCFGTRKSTAVDCFTELVEYRKLVASSQAALKEEQAVSWQRPGRERPRRCLQVVEF